MDVEVRRRIPFVQPKVVAVAFDWRRDHEWTQGIKEASLTQEAPGGGFGEGAQVTRTAYFLGKRIDYTLRVEQLTMTELEMRSVAGPFPMHVTYRFEADGDATQATIRVCGDATGYLRILAPLQSPMVRRNLRRDLRDLERLLAS